MSKPTEAELIKSLALVMTLTENLIMQLGEIAKVYDQMPDDIKHKIGRAQAEALVKAMEAKK